MLSKQLIQAASGSAGAGGVLGIEDVFSTWLYAGNSSTQTITNGIDLAGEGGMVWLKDRTGANSHYLYDTARGATKFLRTNAQDAEVTNTDTLTAFNSNGFSIGVFASHNTTGNSIASWTFRKAPGFFDVVTYTGNGTHPQTISHNLGSIPGSIIVKATSTAGDWWVYHRSLGANYYMQLNSTTAAQLSNNIWGNTAPTATTFTVGSNSLNASGVTYVAYLFAHDEQIFGESGDQSVIKCGSYTGNGSASGPTIDLGWEPQWVMVRKTNGAENWIMYDSMRGVATGGNDAELLANGSFAEDKSANNLSFLSTGFQVTGVQDTVNTSGGTYIYIAIRRGPMKTPTSATEVFDVNYETEARTTAGWTSLSGFVDDAFWMKSTNVGFNWEVGSRLTVKTLSTNTTAAEQANQYFGWDTQDGIKQGTTNYASNSSYSYADYHFRRAPGFFDVVAYTGTGVARSIPHNLGVAPEMLIIKQRNAPRIWPVWHIGGTQINKYWAELHRDIAYADYGDPAWGSPATGTPNMTSSTFSVGTDTSTNQSAGTYIAYLFATLPGISKVGSYTGTATTQQINCGFTSGARFVLIKRTDSTGDWYVWDTARGIVSGNDPYLLLNSTAAEVTSTDYIDPYSAGFEISSTAPAAINASGGTYIYLAIA